MSFFFFATVNQARVIGLWSMEIVETLGVKSEFIRGYLSAVLPGIKGSNIDIDHCFTYQDINIQKDKFGLENDWRLNQNNKTILRTSCVYYLVIHHMKILANRA